MSSTQPEPADERLRAQPDEPPLTADERLRADDAVQPDERLRADAQPAAGSDGDDNVTASKKTSLTSHWDVLPVELKAKIVCMVAFPVGNEKILMQTSYLATHSTAQQTAGTGQQFAQEKAMDAMEEMLD